MRVLFLSNESNRGNVLSAYGHRLDKLRKSIEARGIQTDGFSLRDARVNRPILLHPLNYPSVRQKLMEADFVHAGGDAAYVAKIWSPLMRARVIHDVHGDTYNEARLKWLLHPGLSSLHQIVQSFIADFVEFRRGGKFLVVSRPMQKWLNDRVAGAEDNSALVRNGVDLNVFRPLPTRSDASFIVGYAGGFVGWQGVDNLVNAVDRSSNKRIRLHLIGIGPQDQSLADKIKRQLGDRVKLFNRMDQEKLVRTLAETDVLTIPRRAHPALRVALPTKFAEYLALGKPVIVSDVDETADLIRLHRCGLVAEPNVESWTTTLDNASELSGNERANMGARGRNLAESEFSWERIGEHYADSLQRWLPAH